MSYVAALAAFVHSLTSSIACARVQNTQSENQADRSARPSPTARQLSPQPDGKPVDGAQGTLLTASAHIILWCAFVCIQFMDLHQAVLGGKYKPRPRQPPAPELSAATPRTSASSAASLRSEGTSLTMCGRSASGWCVANLCGLVVVQLQALLGHRLKAQRLDGQRLDRRWLAARRRAPMA